MDDSDFVTYVKIFFQHPHSNLVTNKIRTLEKEMATHSSIVAWRIPWTEEPGRLKLKLQYFGHLMQKADSLEKTLMLGKD